MWCILSHIKLQQKKNFVLYFTISHWHIIYIFGYFLEALYNFCIPCHEPVRSLFLALIFKSGNSRIMKTNDRGKTTALQGSVILIHTVINTIWFSNLKGKHARKFTRAVLRTKPNDRRRTRGYENSFYKDIIIFL